MSRSIAVLVTEGFEDSEYLSPVDALRAAGYAIFNIDVEPGRIVKSRAEQLPLRIDLGIDQARAADYAGLLIPGGRSPGVLRRDPRVLQFVRDCDARRLPIFAICHGPLQPLDQIVLVAVTSAHRGMSFQACEFIMDYLKSEAPFWKKEQTPEGARWVDARVSDEQALARWAETPAH